VATTANPVTEDALQMVHDRTDGGADIVIETSGSAAGRALALAAAAIGGRVVLVGFADSDNRIDVERDIIQKQLDVRGAWMFPITALQTMLRSVARDGADITSLIPHRFGIEQGDQAWRSFDGGSVGKAVITWDE